MAKFDKKSDGESNAAINPVTGAPAVMPGSGDDKKPKKKTKKLKDDTRLAYRVLRRPLISEKGSILAEDGTYLFVVDKRANKKEIAQAVHSVYGIKPEKVRTINVSGKRRQSGNIKGRTMDWKKAVVVLPKGQKIDLYEGI